MSGSGTEPRTSGLGIRVPDGAISCGAALDTAAAVWRRRSGDVVTFASRPAGVAHVYVGPVTPGGHVPSARRVVCGARTRRLVVELPARVPLDPASARMCRRCTRVLVSWNPPGSACTSRDEWLSEFGHLTPFDLAVDAFMAQTAAEVERLEFLALLLVGFPACHTAPVVSPAGKVSAPLDKHLERARARVGGTHADPTGERLDVLVAEGMQRDKAERHQVWKEREERIRQLGFIAATA